MDLPEAPRKRRKLQSPSRPRSPRRNHDSSSQISQSAEARRTRGFTACENCRARKTKCDNDRPSCGYCSRIGARCSYLEDTTNHACFLASSQIMDAIENLSSLIQQQQQQQQQQRHNTSRDCCHCAPPRLRLSYGNVHQPDHDPWDATQPPVDLDDGIGFDSPRLVSLGGLDTICKWPIFGTVQPFEIFPTDDGNRGSYLPRSPPPTDYQELLRLKMKFRDNVYKKCPFLDLHVLNTSLQFVAENGFDWSTQSCLVALVCALGAISQPYQTSLDGSTDINSCNEEIELAFRFWDVAMKRVGIAISQSTLESVQCLCLSGIWYMWNLNPLSGWRTFHLATSSWYSLATQETASGMTKRQRSSIEQSLLFMCYKSTCEIRYELPVPGSPLYKTDPSHMFPLPPSIDGPRQEPIWEGEETTWYYFLAEIACRHLIDRIISTRLPTDASVTEETVVLMCRQLEEFETHLSSWYVSLPPVLSFPIAPGRITPLDDELCQMLRLRYLSIKELLHRPFVEICVNNYAETLAQEQLEQVAYLASSGLEYCAFKVQNLAAQPQRHHGIWLALRSAATASMTLIAARRAQCDSRPRAANLVRLPEAWKEDIVQLKPTFDYYSAGNTGSVQQCWQLIEWALSCLDGEQA